MTTLDEQSTDHGADTVVKVEVDRGTHVATVTLDRPEARNALSSRLLTQLREAMARVDTDPEVHAVVLTGAGKAFCAGLDLKELGSSGGNLGSGGQRDDGSVNTPWPQLSKPIVGAINGPAVTGGFEIALACDVLVGSPAACFADTHIRVGVMPGWALSVLLPAIVGRGLARRMSLTGDYLFAEQALARGLLTEIVPAHELVPAAQRLAATIAGNDPRMTQAYLASYRRIELESLGGGYAVETQTSRSWRADFDNTAVEERRAAIIARGRAQTSSR